MVATVAEIHRYPVKGLGVQRLAEVALAPGETLPDDRRFAIAHGASQFDPAAPAWLPKRQFFQRMTDDRLAALTMDYDPATTALTLKREGRQVARGALATSIGRDLVNQFLAAFLRDPRGAPKVVEAPGISFSDTAEKLVSIINLATVRDIERVVRKRVDPVRFRGNLLVDGLEPWVEFDWIGREIAAGAARLAIIQRIDRCAATNVDPTTAERNLNIPKALLTGFGHADCGVYAAVIVGGRVAIGDPIG